MTDNQSKSINPTQGSSSPTGYEVDSFLADLRQRRRSIVDKPLARGRLISIYAAGGLPPLAARRDAGAVKLLWQLRESRAASDCRGRGGYLRLLRYRAAHRGGGPRMLNCTNGLDINFLKKNAVQPLDNVPQFCRQELVGCRVDASR